jgi:hypothetical protein
MLATGDTTMMKETLPGLTGDYLCPKCKSPMTKKARYGGGSAEMWVNIPVSSSGSVYHSIYPQQDEYECTNPQCKKSLLRPSIT